MSNALEQFESTTNHNTKSVRFDNVNELYKDEVPGMHRQQVAEASARMTADAQLPQLTLTDLAAAKANPDIVRTDMTEWAQRKMAIEEATNAARQLPGLMWKAGVKADGRDGLNKDDLQKLLDADKKDDKLTADQRRAIKYMLDNYETLQTGGWRFNDRITPDSLKQHAPDAMNVDPVRTERTRRELEAPVPVEKSKPVEVKAGWGWYRIAEESLRQGGSGKPSIQEILDETRRLQQLNPDKVKMVHPGDKIRTSA